MNSALYFVALKRCNDFFVKTLRRYWNEKIFAADYDVGNF